jgi:hypothetical protein
MTITAELQALRCRFTTVTVASAVRYLAEVAVLAGLYYGSARLGYALRFGWAATIVWLPAGVGICSSTPRPAVLAGQPIGDLWAHHHYANVAFGTAAGLTLANLVEVLVGALRFTVCPGGDSEERVEACPTLVRSRSPP